MSLVKITFAFILKNMLLFLYGGINKMIKTFFNDLKTIDKKIIVLMFKRV